MSKSFDNIEWVCKLHDDLNADADKERIWLEKHYGHKPEVLAKRLAEHEVVFTMAHEMLDHLHNMAVGARNLVTIPCETIPHI